MKRSLHRRRPVFHSGGYMGVIEKGSDIVTKIRSGRKFLEGRLAPHDGAGESLLVADAPFRHGPLMFPGEIPVAGVRFAARNCPDRDSPSGPSARFTWPVARRP
jgi:hypothetical protein